jgi:hypothetical protein
LLQGVQVSASVYGSATFLNQTATLNGNVSFGAGGISAANLTMSMGAVNYNGLKITADTDPNNTCPTIATGAGTVAPTPGPNAPAGPFVQVAYGGGSDFTAAFSGEVQANGVEAAGCGTLSSAGASFSGALELNGLLDAPVHIAGAFYWGTPAAGVMIPTDTLCTTSTQTCSGDGYLEQQAQQYDWYIDMGTTGSENLDGFTLTADFGAGSFGGGPSNGTTYVHGIGGLAVGTASTGANIQGSMDLSADAQGNFSYDFVGAGSVTIDSYTLANAAVSFSNAGGSPSLALAAQVQVPVNGSSVPVTVSGSVVEGTPPQGESELTASCNINADLPDGWGTSLNNLDPADDSGTADSGGVAFCFYGSIGGAGISLLGSTDSLTGSVVLASSTDDLGYFSVSGTYVFPLSLGSVSFNGSFGNGTVDGSGTLSANSTLANTTISGTAGICAGTCSNFAATDYEQGIWVSVTANVDGVSGLNVTGSINSPTNWSLSLSLSNQSTTAGPITFPPIIPVIEVGANLSYNITGTVSSGSGFQLGDSNLSITPWYETYGCDSFGDCIEGKFSWSSPNYFTWPGEDGTAANSSFSASYSNGQVCLSGNEVGTSFSSVCD